ncbi:hypothetical protein Tco_0019458 [Tanacetum coccineum]
MPIQSLEVGEELEIDLPHATEEHSQPPSPTNKVTHSKEPTHPESQPEATHHEEPLSTEHQSPTPDAKHEEAAASYADLQAEIEAFHDETYKTQGNTDASLRNYEKSLAWNVGPRLTKIELTQESIKSNIASLKTDTADIKAMMTEIFYTFKGQSFSTSLGNLLMPTLILTNTKEYKETPFQPEGEQVDMAIEEAKPEEPKGAKGMATKTYPSPPKPIKALMKVCVDPNAPILIEYMIRGKMVQITHDQLQTYLEKKEEIELAIKEAELSKPEITKVAAEVVNKTEVQILGNKKFLKHQDAHLQVHTRAHNEKLKKKVMLKSKRFDSYVWTVTNRYKPKRITDIYIHPRTRPVLVTVYRNNDPRNFEVHKEFKFIDFGLNEWDELNAILPKKSNKCVDPSLPRRKRKAIELEPKTYIAGLHCKRELPERVKFVNNILIEMPEHGLFIIDAFGDKTFQRVSDIHKVETKTLLGYNMMALNVKTTENQRFMVLMSRMIDECPNKDKILTKRVKLENLGYTDV